MKKDSGLSVKAKGKTKASSAVLPSVQSKLLTVGLDLGDQFSDFHILDLEGETVETGRIRTTRPAFEGKFGSSARYRIAMEVGGHSRWVSQLVEKAGHEVFVANARQARYITEADNKSDRTDAHKLARLARMDWTLLHPIVHRSEAAQRGIALIRARAVLVRARTMQINCLRGMVKATGVRLRKCDADDFTDSVVVPAELKPIFDPVLRLIKQVNLELAVFDTKLAELGDQLPDARRLMTVPGVGILTAVTFILTIDNPERLDNNRAAGALLGLVPKRSQSGKVDKALGITKAGDPYLRSLLVQSAQRIMQANMKDSDLRDWGLQLAGAGAADKKRAVVAMARKLSVLLTHIWRTGDFFEPREPSAERARQEQNRAAKKARKLAKLQEKLARPRQMPTESVRM